MSNLGYKQTEEHKKKKANSKRASVAKVKKCPICQKSKDRKTEFYQYKNRVSSYCIVCSRKRNIKNKENFRALWAQRTYGLSMESYKIIWERQNGCCAICKRHETEFSKNLSVDHDHKTGKVRGLLCGSCNRAIGLFQDDGDVMEQAAKYVRSF